MAQPAPVAAAPSIGHYLRPLRRHRGLIVVVLIIGLVLGGLAAVKIRPTYTGNSRVQVQADATDNNTAATGARTSGTINMDTELQVARSFAVAARAQTLLKTTTTPDQLLTHLTVAVPPNTTILTFSFTAHSKAQALAGANAFATAYIANRTAVSQEFIDNGIRTTTTQLTAAQARVDADTTRFDQLPQGSTARHQLFLKQQADQSQVTTYGTQLAQYRSITLNPGSVLNDAVPSGSPNRTRELAIITGIVLGLLFGLLGAFLRERFARTIRCADDLERFGLPVIAEMGPSSRTSRKGVGRGSDAASRTRLDQRTAAAAGAALRDGGGSIYLLELSPAATTSNLAERLASEMARFGSTAEVVTSSNEVQWLAAPNGPAVAAAPGTPIPAIAEAPTGVPAEIEDDEPELLEEAGLGWPQPAAPTTLVPRHQPKKRTIPTEDQPAAELPAAREPGDGQELVVAKSPAIGPVSGQTPVLQQVQAALSRSRYVVIEGDDPLNDSQAYVLASIGHVSVLIIEADVTTRADLAEALDHIEVTSTNVIGAVLWRAPTKRELAKESSEASRGGGLRPAGATVSPVARPSDVLPESRNGVRNDQKSGKAKGGDGAKASAGASDRTT